jgi:23S rRNA (pseudouridine1915-N3)-methyltransferase
LKAEPRDRGKTAAQVLAAEAVRLAAACKSATIVALDERGEKWTTRVPGRQAGELAIEARDVAFVIGSADGLAESVKRNASATFSLSALTLPHGLVRIIVAEQLYRAVSLLSRHPYHRE